MPPSKSIVLPSKLYAVSFQSSPPSPFRRLPDGGPKAGGLTSLACGCQVKNRGPRKRKRGRGYVKLVYYVFDRRADRGGAGLRGFGRHGRGICEDSLCGLSCVVC